MLAASGHRMSARTLFTVIGGVNRCVAGLSAQCNVSRAGSQIPSWLPGIEHHGRIASTALDHSEPSSMRTLGRAMIRSRSTRDCLHRRTTSVRCPGEWTEERNSDQNHRMFARNRRVEVRVCQQLDCGSGDPCSPRPSPRPGRQRGRRPVPGCGGDDEPEPGPARSIRPAVKRVGRRRSPSTSFH